MKKLLKISMLFTLLFAAASVAAQKFGHINTGNLLAQMPETKVADEKLKTFQDSLIAIGQGRADSLQIEILAFSQDYNAGNLTPVVAQKKQAELQKRKADLETFENEVIDQVAQMREVLISPILEKVDAAIKAIGKEGGYTMIFDTSLFNTILFAEDSDDIEPMVKLKLGLETVKK